MEKAILNRLQNTQIKILDKIVEICETNNLQYFLIGGTLLGAVRHQGFIPWDDDLDIAMPRKDYEIFLRVCERYLGDNLFLDSFETNNKYWLPFVKIRMKNTIYQESVLIDYKGYDGIWVDIFPLDNASKEMSILQKIQFYFFGKIKSVLAYVSEINYIRSRNPIKILGYTICAFIPKKCWFWMQKKIMIMNKNEKSNYFVNLGSQYGIKKQTHLKSKYYPSKKIQFVGKKYNVPNDFDYVLTKIYGANYMQLPPIEKRVTHNPVRIKFQDGVEILFDKK